MNFDEKREALLCFIRQLMQNDIALAFSGGVDSSLLLGVCADQAKTSGKKVYAITIHTKLHPVKDIEIAKKVAGEAGAKHILLYLDELAEAGIGHNPENRCYLCKRCLFKKLIERAGELGVTTIIEGTNEDDMHVYRPGIRALEELGIISPLARFGFSKEEVRRLAFEYGISVANRPSTPCMATRFPYGTRLDYDTIRKVEAAEEWIKDKGFYNVRIRVHDNIARIEIDQEDMISFIENRDDVICRLKEYGLDYITLDLEGFRSGSMDLHIGSKNNNYKIS